MTDGTLATLSRTFDRLYSATGRPSIPPEQLLRALLLLQTLYTVRSERLLIEQLQYNCKRSADCILILAQGFAGARAWERGGLTAGDAGILGPVRASA